MADQEAKRLYAMSSVYRSYPGDIERIRVTIVRTRTT